MQKIDTAVRTVFPKIANGGKFSVEPGTYRGKCKKLNGNRCTDNVELVQQNRIIAISICAGDHKSSTLTTTTSVTRQGKLNQHLLVPT